MPLVWLHAGIKFNPAAPCLNCRAAHCCAQADGNGHAKCAPHSGLYGKLFTALNGINQKASIIPKRHSRTGKTAGSMINRMALARKSCFFEIYSRRMIVKPKIWLASGWLAALILPSGAFAALGANVSSIETDKTQMKAAIRMADANSKYTTHELQTPAGTVIREYVTPAGKIFAVAWQGPFMPDLRQLLGTYFDEYNNAAQENHAGHNRLGIRRPGLVVYSSGHMRAFSGKAYIPQMLPQGVTVDEIQ